MLYYIGNTYNFEISLKKKKKPNFVLHFSVMRTHYVSFSFTKVNQLLIESLLGMIKSESVQTTTCVSYIN